MMPHYVAVLKKKGMPGCLGPYTETRANSISDNLDEDSVVIEVESTNKTEARREVKEKLVREYGYEKGSRRMSRNARQAKELSHF
jgi:hypothetical protein